MASIRFTVVTTGAALTLAAAVAFAQPLPPSPSQPPPPPEAMQQVFSQQELDQMLAPIALYPDSLLSQILMAATYPLEVVEAARWSAANPGLRGEDAVRAAAQQVWDPSVKSLLAFPQVLAMMSQRLDWTQRLGDAFLAQQPQVMDTVQELRRRAYAAGNLRTDQQVRVYDEGGDLDIAPVDPQAVYVPYYDPLVMYGPWWWPAYPPIRWAPWPGYHVRRGFSVGFAWGAAVAISLDFFFGAFDWRQHHVRVARAHNFYYHSRVNTEPGPWRHDPGHRGGVPYRSEAARREFNPPHAGAGTRDAFRGREPSAIARPPEAPARPEVRSRPEAASRPEIPAARPAAPPVRPAAPSAAAPAARPAVRPAAPEPPPHAFEGIREGAGRTREFSSRGHESVSRPAAPAGGPARGITPPAAAPSHGFAPPAGGARGGQRR